jgi:NAD+ diphosphatase
MSRTEKLCFFSITESPCIFLWQAILIVASSQKNAVARAIKEETGMTVSHIKFNRTKFYEPSNTLMCNFTAFVKDDSDLNTNGEIDKYKWFEKEEARKNILPDSLASIFLNSYLDE